MRKNILILLALMALPTQISAQDFGGMARFEILPGWRTPSGDHIAAAKITLAPGWITYWRVPGEVGIPPQFSFSSDSDIAMITPHLPVPEVFDKAGIISIGYENSVIFPLTVDTNGVTGDIPLSGALSVGVCEEICIPATFTFETVLPQSGRRDAGIIAALDSKPLTAGQANAGKVTCVIDPIEDGLRVTTRIDVRQSSTSEYVVIEPSDPNIWVSQTEVVRSGASLSGTVEMALLTGGPFAFDRSAVRITVLNNDGSAVDLRGCSAG